MTDDEKVLDESGRFHATDAPIDLSGYAWEDWLALAFFWLLAIDVFYQFFTRYVLSDSAGWTEEIARYLLIVVTFVGASMAVRRNTHIHVEFIYRYLPPLLGRVEHLEAPDLELLDDAVVRGGGLRPTI